MSTEPIIVTVDADLADLIPIFLSQRRADLATLAAALPARDFEAIRRVGHGMAGAGASYGFDHLSVLGEHIVEAGRAADVQALTRLIAEFDDYLARLSVKFL